MIDVTVTGVSGRMGRQLAKAVEENDRTRLVGATVIEGDPWAGQRMRDVLDLETDIVVEVDPLEAIARSDAIIDFTAPQATHDHATLAAQAGAAHVIGTTGLEADTLAHLSRCAVHTKIVRAGNFSLGVNLLTVLTRKVAAALGPEFDIEIVEMHHRHKVDAPSGTALMLGEAAAEGRGIDLAAHTESGRHGLTGAREEGAIGFAALRGGAVIGEHSAIFASTGERITLGHIAEDRMLFARGAVTAAIWAHAQKPGEYDMIDVLGLRD
ncbi:4-hydroxy-tetrahydrodipicolinate reductase [Pontivivens insulae]|uniref:4-hydroxy-tetrahydrodipicolinate reductase n=1 Tax=Pontivivens insulae TaxID=1639689 RepID=A0A2R8AEZ0_9RHOB|nr:4-hydroxy-tetrahydrodipicolinate reductase [Pontivivens insulae]RED12067.1 dihydrodipicolinate reductase [Pontivivens insulae]SPF30823.1 4-hydroxy-tetrahydrodipicolinate reductase [Pontivivens insulae]